MYINPDRKDIICLFLSQIHLHFEFISFICHLSFWFVFDIYEVLMTINVARARRGCARMVVQVTTTNEISAYHH